MILLLLLVLGGLLLYLIERESYEDTEYFAQTGNSFQKVRRDKGLLGEYYIYKRLSGLPGYKRFVFNCYLPKSNEEKTEIDVILIHETGLYVLESKNYGGWIFGTETNQYWTQTLPAGRGRSQKIHFPNPIIQNKVHLKWLKAFLQEDSLNILSYIVFSERCTLKSISLTSGEHRVIKRNDLENDIAGVIQDTNSCLSTEKIDELYDMLQPLTNVDREEKEAHIHKIQEKYYAPRDIEHENKCPVCGGKLILRTATKGSRAGKQFWGCSNYPKCKYVQNIE